MLLTHPYHIVAPSPWPIYVSLSLLSVLLNLVSSSSLIVSTITLVILCYSGL